jgi:hypothetical protein
MELIIPFKSIDYSDDGTHIRTGKYIMELQREWEESFHNQYKPYYANVIEGHPLAMLRITRYMNSGEDTNFDYGMELINGNIDIETNCEIEKFSDKDTVYGIGSQYHEDEDHIIFLVKNDSIRDDILILKYVPEDDEDTVSETVPVIDSLVVVS